MCLRVSGKRHFPRLVHGQRPFGKTLGWIFVPLFDVVGCNELRGSYPLGYQKKTNLSSIYEATGENTHVADLTNFAEPDQFARLVLVVGCTE